MTGNRMLWVLGTLALVGVLLILPMLTIGGTDPVLLIETSMGNITVELFRDKAPLSVKNFVQYAQEGHYDGTIFHRVIGDFMIQGGGFEPSELELRERPTKHPPIKNESSNGLSNQRGTIAMARTQHPDSATAQFFINVVDNRKLDAREGQAGYTVFGRVLDGMSVVDEIRRVETQTLGVHENVPRRPVIIKNVRQIR